MEIFYSSRFLKRYKKLTKEIKKDAEEKEDIFRKDYKDARLKTHKLHGKYSNY